MVGVDKDRGGATSTDFEAGKKVVPDGEFPVSDDDELRMGFVDFSDQVAITGSLPWPDLRLASCNNMFK